MENYDKLREIGKGSYGVVWLVKHIKDRKNYVLKKIDLRRSSERDKLSAQQEAQLLKSLKHPNIVSYKESFHTDGYLHIVMLFCEGGDLYTKIKEQNSKFIEEAQIVEWFVQIAMALQYLHEKNILHRDLKTQNIFLTRNKIIKVGDLGIARVLKGNNDMATTIIGTPYYMSPELFSNKPYNSKSDVWALGCVVYEMTTLKHAFNAKDMSSLVFKITRGKMPAIPPHYSREFITLIESMLNIDPKKRPTANKILRDNFIKKNIMLFLERTKQKQQQLEVDNANRAHEQHQHHQQPPTPQPEVRSEFLNLNNFISVSSSQETKEKQQQLRQPLQSPFAPASQSHPRSNYSIASRSPINENAESEPDFRQLKNNNQSRATRHNSFESPVKEVAVSAIAVLAVKDDNNDYVHRSGSSQNQKPAAVVRKGVRISPIVHNIETREPYERENEGGADYYEDEYENENHNNDDDDDEDYENAEDRPAQRNYELTKPIKLAHLNELPPGHRIRAESSESQQNHQPKIVERNRSCSQAGANAQPSASPKASSSDNHPFNLDARERRRQRLRLSQNESNPVESKPPVLKKYAAVAAAAKSSKSEGSLNSPSSPSSGKPVSKSYTDEKSRLPFEDSMKIIKKNNPSPNNSAYSNNSIDQRDAKSLNIKKQMEILSPSESSSSSSVASSSDDNNDPGNRLIRIEKLKKKEKREIGNLIDKLSCTLQAADQNVSRIETDVEDLKDEVLDDLEEEVLQAESAMQAEQSSLNRGVSDSNRPGSGAQARRPVAHSGGIQQRKEAFGVTNDDEDIIMVKENRSFSNARNVAGYNNQSFGIKAANYEEESALSADSNNLGATNHMQTRINGLEKECLQVIGREKLNEAFKILDSFKETEVEQKLTELIGKQFYKEYNGKLWLLKFCKDTAKISYR